MLTFIQLKKHVILIWKIDQLELECKD